MQRLVIGAIAGSLFSNIRPTDITSLNGFLFFSVLFNALSAFPMIPIVYAQKAVYYKHADASFYPTVVYVAAQSIVLLPLHILEVCHVNHPIACVYAVLTDVCVFFIDGIYSDNIVRNNHVLVRWLD
jgi:hypothetical protein